MRIRPLILIPTPQQSSNEEDKAAYTQKTSHEIDLGNCLSSSQTHRVDSRWWEVVKQDHQQAEEIPNSADKSTPPPRRVISDELSIKHTRRKRHNSKHQHTHILPPLRRWRQLTRSRQRRQLINTSTGTGQCHACDERIHGFGGGADDAADDGQPGTDECTPATAEEVGKGADEGADCCEGYEVGLHEPDPSVGACGRG